MSTPVEIRCLGTFSLGTGEDRVRRWRAGKTKNLLQYLLLRRGKVVLRETLYDVLWPSPECAAPATSLKVAVHALRRILEEHQPGAGESALRVVTEEGGYMLEGEAWVDFEVFEEAVDRGHAAELAGDREAALEAYQLAVELYQGDFLAGETAIWVEERREWLKGRMLLALDYLTTDALERRDYAAVTTLCRDTLEIEPFREEAYRHLMLVDAKLGNRGRVRTWHDLCRRKLQEELAVEPEHDTERLYHLALRGELGLARTG